MAIGCKGRRICTKKYSYVNLSWHGLPVVYLPCPHKHFRADTINRDILTKDDHLNLLSTPKGYRWEMSATQLQAKRRCRKKVKGMGTSDERYIHSFLKEIWNIMTPDMVERLREILVQDFKMTFEEAEAFIREQQANMKEEKDKQKNMCKCCCQNKNNVPHLGIRHLWIREFTEMMACKLSDYVVMMLCNKRGRRARLLAEVILCHLCDITGEEVSLGSAKTRMQRILVFIADRLAIWLDCIFEETEKKYCQELYGGGDDGRGGDDSGGGKSAGGKKAPHKPKSAPPSPPKSPPKSPPRPPKSPGGSPPKTPTKGVSPKDSPPKSPDKPNSPTKTEPPPSKLPPKKPPSPECDSPPKTPAGIAPAKAAPSMDTGGKPRSAEKPKSAGSPPAPTSPPAPAPKSPTSVAKAAVQSVTAAALPAATTAMDEATAVVMQTAESIAAAVRGVAGDCEENKKRDRDLMDVVAEWIAETEPAQSRRQCAINVVIMNKIEKEVGEVDDQMRVAICKVSAKVSTWVDTLAKEAEMEAGAYECAPEGTKEEICRPATPAAKKTRKNQAVYHVRKTCGNYYNVQQIGGCLLAAKMAEARGLCEQPESLNNEEVKNWARWAIEVAAVAENWAQWIDKRVEEAEDILARKKKKKDGPQPTPQEWKKWKKDTLEEALKFRKDRKRLLRDSTVWGSKDIKTES